MTDSTPGRIVPPTTSRLQDATSEEVDQCRDVSLLPLYHQVYYFPAEPCDSQLQWFHTEANRILRCREQPVFAGLLFLVSLFFEGGSSSKHSNMSLSHMVILMLKMVHVRATLSIIISNCEEKSFHMFPLMPRIKAFNTSGDYWLLQNYFTQCVWLYHCS